MRLDNRQKEPRQEAQREKTIGWMILKMILKDPSVLINLRRLKDDEERYLPPPRRYDLPVFQKDMRYSSSREPYLRRTRWCDPGEPLVIALAHELGAYGRSDREFAEAAYWWMKNNMWYAMTGFDGPTATLRRGSGMCFHLTNTYIALCRCVGIKARYKNYRMKMRNLEREVFTNVDPGFASLFDSLGGVIEEAEVELYLDGTWTTAYLAQTAALTSATGWPVSEFGESSLDIYFNAIPGSVRHFESIPLGLGFSLKLMNILAPATMERLNARMARIQYLGLQEIENAGGLQEYNQAAKRRREINSADDLLDQAALKHYDKIIVKK